MKHEDNKFLTLMPAEVLSCILLKFYYLLKKLSFGDLGVGILHR